MKKNKNAGLHLVAAGLTQLKQKKLKNLLIKNHLALLPMIESSKYMWKQELREKLEWLEDYTAGNDNDFSVEEVMRRFIEKEIIEKIIDDIPNFTMTDGKDNIHSKFLKQQLKATWLERN